jgi:hypothetical protein
MSSASHRRAAHRHFSFMAISMLSALLVYVQEHRDAALRLPVFESRRARLKSRLVAALGKLLAMP